MIYKKLFLVLLLLSLMLTLCQCVYPTDELVFMAEGEAVKAADVYGDIDAVVAENGNCYIRGKNMSSSYMYGVENTKQYLNLYKTLDFSKANQFTQIYAGGDAKSIRLSSQGGVIITEDSKVVLFTDIEGFKTPALFCDNAQSALLVKDRVYILSPDGTFGYRAVKKPDTFISVAKNIKQFEVGSQSNSFWLLTDTNTLSLYTDEACQEALWQIEAVSGFDIWYDGDDVVDGKYNFAYITNGACYYYAGYGLENAKEFANELMPEGAVSATVHSGGVLVLTEDKEVLVFGKGPYSNDAFSGEVIAKDATMLCGDFGKLAIVTESGGLTVVGELPDSTSVGIKDLIERQKTGDG